jgi:hypothetical protein
MMRDMAAQRTNIDFRRTIPPLSEPFGYQASEARSPNHNYFA